MSCALLCLPTLVVQVRSGALRDRAVSPGGGRAQANLGEAPRARGGHGAEGLCLQASSLQTPAQCRPGLLRTVLEQRAKILGRGPGQPAVNCRRDQGIARNLQSDEERGPGLHRLLAATDRQGGAEGVGDPDAGLAPVAVAHFGHRALQRHGGLLRQRPAPAERGGETQGAEGRGEGIGGLEEGAGAEAWSKMCRARSSRIAQNNSMGHAILWRTSILQFGHGSGPLHHIRAEERQRTHSFLRQPIQLQALSEPHQQRAVTQTLGGVLEGQPRERPRRRRPPQRRRGVGGERIEGLVGLLPGQSHVQRAPAAVRAARRPLQQVAALGQRHGGRGRDAERGRGGAAAQVDREGQRPLRHSSEARHRAPERRRQQQVPARLRGLAVGRHQQVETVAVAGRAMRRGVVGLRQQLHLGLELLELHGPEQAVLQGPELHVACEAFAIPGLRGRTGPGLGEGSGGRGLLPHVRGQPRPEPCWERGHLHAPAVLCGAPRLPAQTPVLAPLPARLVDADPGAAPQLCRQQQREPEPHHAAAGDDHLQATHVFRVQFSGSGFHIDGLGIHDVRRGILPLPHGCGRGRREAFFARPLRGARLGGR
mmetsp:Transcript_92785/g.298322  ORF Transcript_92785/g.298322 Transcript_92785/m.298322 type:complete len:595 (-) Transcript_92785:106-1890(-)